MTMRLRAGIAGFAAALLASASPALAQEEAPGDITVSGSASLVSDYRFRGVSQTDEEMAIQGGITVTHAIGGFSAEVGSGVTVDVGLTWYMYPGGASTTDFAEPYVKLSSNVGPATALVGVAYAPKQRALGRVYFDADAYVAGVPDRPGAKSDNLYVWGDLSSGIPNMPVSLKGHLGYSNGNSGLGPNGTSVAPTGDYFDWMLGADLALGPVTLGVAYVDTSISNSEAAYLRPNFASSKDGSSISSSTVVFSITAGF